MTNEGFPENPGQTNTRGFASLTIATVLKGTKYPKEAMQYVDFQLGPLAQLCVANYIAYAPTNKTLEPVLAAYPEISRQLPSPADIEKVYVPDWPVINRDFPQWLEMWNRTVTRP
jgi:spermidine/putrescine-binding protein